MQDDSADTAIVNDYSPVNTIDFIEYSMNNMGISTEIAADLANHVNTAGAGGRTKRSPHLIPKGIYEGSHNVALFYCHL